MDIRQKYKDYCESKGIRFQDDTSILSYDDTSLFCPAGMQQFKNQFNDDQYKDTCSNIQSCLRLNDIDEIGDGTHLLYFNMIGLFSFREMTLQESINFWIEFLEEELKLEISYITIHPDKLQEWKSLYDSRFEIREDLECIWSDGGELKGYCTEFYIDGVEIGNIVNTREDCIDVGFGLERLDMFVNKIEKSEIDILKETIVKMIESGVFVSNNNQGYVLKKLIRILIRKGVVLEIEEFQNEVVKYNKMLERYDKLKVKDKNKNKTSEWWWDTHGIDVSQID